MHEQHVRQDIKGGLVLTTWAGGGRPGKASQRQAAMSIRLDDQKHLLPLPAQPGGGRDSNGDFKRTSVLCNHR